MAFFGIGLILAAGTGHEEIAEVLVEAGANKSTRYTGIVLQAGNWHADIARMLLESGSHEWVPSRMATQSPCSFQKRVGPR